MRRQAGLSVFCESLRRITFCLVFFAATYPQAINAQEAAAKLDPASSTIKFTLGATLHTVHGTFKMRIGEIHFDSATGKASGSIVIDATSGESGDSSRDNKMHKEILESAKYPDIVFSPTQLIAQPGHALKETLDQKGTMQVQAKGIFRLHGQDHDVTLDLAVQNDGNGHVQISSSFPIPYIKWGLKNPNTFILRVSDTVQLEIHASGQIIRAQ
ncbi:MAG: YceI family protein [Candidatus Acidiferrales bacterium]